MAVASGKGGTGKTLVSTNLAAASSSWLADLDVESPNCHLFSKAGPETVKGIYRAVACISREACDLCGECASSCRFGAILGLLDRVTVREEACHGCGTCMEVCPKSAITFHERRTGELCVRQWPVGGLVSGQLRVGEPSSVPLIRATKAALPEGETAILDCPPGTGCGVAESLRGVDLCLLVTEPTPFGLHDLKLAARLTSKMKLPTVALVNKEGLGGPDMQAECASLGIEVVGTLPFDRRIAETYSKGRLLVSEARHRELFERLWKECLEAAGR